MRTRFRLPSGTVAVLCGNLAAVAVGLVTEDAWAANGTWSSVANLQGISGQNTATLLQDGRVLVTGWRPSPFPGGEAAEVYDPASDTWTPQADPIAGLGILTAAPLGDGRVLFVGGTGTFGYQSSQIFDPVTNGWTRAADLNIPRYNGKVAALPDGRVLIAGGVPRSGIELLRDAEIYDPTSDTWTITGSMAAALPWFTMATLQDGTVLAAGGGYDDITAEVYDPVSGAWSLAGALTGAEQQFTLTPLPDGRALAVGGPFTHHLYDPLTRTWRVTAQSHINAFFTTATLLLDGTVIVAGTNYSGLGSDVFDPSTETWQVTGNLVQTPRQHHSAARLNDGKVLIVGGYYEGGPCDEGTCTVYTLGSAEIFTPDGP